MVGASKEKRKGSEDLEEGERKRGKLDLRRQLKEELEALEKELEAVEKELEELIQERDMWRSLAQGEGGKRARGRGRG